VLERVTLLMGQAHVNPFTSASNCDLVVKGIINGQQRGFFYNNSTDVFLPDRTGAPTMTAQQLIDAAGAGAELTFKGVPVGAGRTFAHASQNMAGMSGDVVVNLIAPSTVQFSAPNFNFSEGAGDAAITVTRTGDTSQSASVVYATLDNPAAVRCADTQTMPNV